MAKDNYFDNDGNIVSKKTVADNIKPVFSSLLNKINEQKAAQEKAEREAAAERRHSEEAGFPKDILEMINADSADVVSSITEEIKAAEPAPQRAAEIAREKPITVSAEAEPEEEKPEDIVGAIKAFSHKSGETISSVAGTIKKNTIAVAAVIEEKERESSKLHRAIVICSMFLLTILIFVGFIGVFMHQMNAENKKMSDFNAAAGEVCADYVKKYGASSYENLYSTYGVSGYRLTGICFVREMDFNNDGSSELMVAYNKNGEYYNEVWGFNDKDEFVALYSEKTAQTEDKSKDAYSTVYRKNNKYYIAKYKGKSLKKFELWQLKGDKFEKKYNCVYNAKTQSYAVDGKDDTTAFERIKYSVFIGEKAVAESEKAAKVINGFMGEDSIAKQIKQKQSIKNAYYSIIQEYNRRYGPAKLVEKDGLAYLEGLAVVDLIDFDGNGKNELLLVFRKPIKVRNEDAEGYVSYDVDTYYCEIYRYTGSKAVLAYSSEGLSNSINDSKDAYFIIKKDGKKSLFCTNSFNISDYGRYIYATSSIFKFDGTSFSPQYSVSYETQYGWTEYFIDGDEVSKTTFEEKAYEVPLFDGSEDGGYNTDSYRVVYVQRSSKNKADVDSQPSKTEKAIQKLNPSYSAN